MDLNNSLAPLLTQVRMAMLSGMDQEFLRDEESRLARGDRRPVRHHGQLC